MHPSRPDTASRTHRHRLFALLLWCAATACAKDPPLDPWSDAQWRNALAGLKAGDVRGVRWSEQVFDPAAEASSQPTSSQSQRLTFGDDGRLANLSSERSRRGERDERRQLRYQWSAGGDLLRIDDEAVSRAELQRQYDAGGHLLLQLERRGEVLERTTFQYDAAGHERERVVDRGKATAPVRERRSYHPNGALKTLDVDTKGGPTRAVTFDPLGRPVKISSRDAKALRVTQIRYPSSLSAVYDDSAAILSGGGLRRYTREISLRVRRGDELATAGEPEQPLVRREARDGSVSETQTDFDDAGRPIRRRQLIDDRVRCVTEWQYHD